AQRPRHLCPVEADDAGNVLFTGDVTHVVGIEYFCCRAVSDTPNDAADLFLPLDAAHVEGFNDICAAATTLVASDATDFLIAADGARIARVGDYPVVVAHTATYAVPAAGHGSGVVHAGEFSLVVSDYAAGRGVGIDCA